MQKSRPWTLSQTVCGIAAHCAGVMVMPRSMSATGTICACAGSCDDQHQAGGLQEARDRPRPRIGTCECDTIGSVAPVPIIGRSGRAVGFNGPAGRDA